MQELVITNASSLLHDQQVMDMVSVLQTQIDRDFRPAWKRRARAVKVTFADINDILVLTSDVWAVFLNKHSDAPGALGWHDNAANQNIPIYSRVFVGDCMKFGLNWEVTLSHEVLELILDPDVSQVWKMPDGRRAALEACDATESDDQAYDIDGHKVSNFVLPSYFSTGKGPYDHLGKLTAPCPALTPGGYMSIQERDGSWTQIFADAPDGLASRRFLGKGHRRMMRNRRLLKADGGSNGS